MVRLGIATSCLAAIAAVGCARDGGADDRPTAAAAPSEAPAPAPAAEEPPEPRRGSCEAQSFASSVDIAEASGAVHLGDAAALLVIGDSGTRGAYALLDADTGATTDDGRLPLDDGASDDLEGLSARGGTFYALTSAGWMRHWRRTGDGFELSAPAYPIGEPGSELACASPRRTNCGPNYEGLCLDPGPAEPGACVGVAIAKAQGLARCLVTDDAGRLRVDPARAIEVGRPKAMSGCHIDPDTGDLLVGANLFGASEVVRVAGWREPKTAIRSSLGPLGVGFPEALAAAPGGLVYRFSDLARAPSSMAKYRCR